MKYWNFIQNPSPLCSGKDLAIVITWATAWVAGLCLKSLKYRKWGNEVEENATLLSLFFWKTVTWPTQVLPPLHILLRTFFPEKKVWKGKSDLPCLRKKENRVTDRDYKLFFAIKEQYNKRKTAQTRDERDKIKHYSYRKKKTENLKWPAKLNQIFMNRRENRGIQ